MIKIEFQNGPKELAKVLHYYNLLEQTESYKIVCPFHNDVNASMLINIEEGRYYCFGCNRNGDALDFVKDANPELNDLELMLRYYKIIKSKKVKFINYNKDINISKKNKVSNDKSNNIIANDYYMNLKTIDWNKINDPIKEYMLHRGFEATTLTKVKAKLTYSNDHYPIIFPMNDMGVFRGWVCRTSNANVEKKRKYLYNKGFHRRDTIVGKYDNETVLLVEGFMDYLKMKQFGIKYIGAILGWKITSAQISKLKAYGVKNIISALDTDNCGNKGTKELEKYFNVIRFQFPEGIKDPGDLDKESFIAANNKTKKLFKEGKKC